MHKKKFTPAEKREALRDAQAAQDAFWEALADLERALGYDVRSTIDLSGARNLTDLRRLCRIAGQKGYDRT